jgi:hypothetical protein
MSIAIAKRQLQRGAADTEIIGVLRLADQLMLHPFPHGTSPEDVLNASKKELAREIRKARRVIFQMLLEGRDRNQPENPQRAALFSEVLDTLVTELPSWDRVFASGIANAAREQFDLAIDNKPQERIAKAHHELPTCAMCNVVKAQEMYLNFETWETVPMCSSCAVDQTRRL